MPACDISLDLVGITNSIVFITVALQFDGRNNGMLNEERWEPAGLVAMGSV